MERQVCGDGVGIIMMLMYLGCIVEAAISNKGSLEVEFAEIVINNKKQPVIAAMTDAHADYCYSGR
jgi:hypothetical protein